MIAKATITTITTIWIVEDNEIFAKRMRRLIDAEDDMTCPHRFACAEDFIDKLKSTTERPDLLLLDIGLPGRDGLEILGDVRSMLPELKVLILTVFDDREKVYRAICNGASGYLLKTDGPDEILAGIRVVMDGATAISNPIARMILDRWRDYGVSSTAPA
jgi:DNA-binding NarL/FixJ family response regulator